MKQDSQDLTSGSLSRKILTFSIPLMASNVLQVLFNMSDIAVVGQFAGAMALGAVGSTTTLVTLFTGFLIGMGTGVNVLTARYYGSKNKKDLSEVIHTSAVICLISGVLIALIGEVSARLILDLLGTKTELVDGALLYLRIYYLGMPAVAVYNFGNAVFSAIGNTKKPLVYLAVSGVVNVLLNLFFVIVCHMSVAGVAIASISAQYLSSILILNSLFHSEDVYGMHVGKLKITKTKARQILAMGIPSGLQYAIFQIANLFIQGGVNTFNAVMVAGNSAAANADALIYDVMAAFYTACGSFMGQNYGAGKKDRVKKSYLISLGYSFGIAACMSAVLLMFGREFLSLFTREADVIDAGMKRLVIMGLSYPVSAFMDCTIAASRGLGKSVVPTVIVIMGSCVFRVVWIYTVFAYFGTFQSLYLLYVFSWSITAVAEVWYFKGVYKRMMQAA